MLVSMDVGEARNLHPVNKKPIGIRLAKAALNRTYGKLDVGYQGPRYQYLTLNKNKAIIHFEKESLAKGLQTNDGKAPSFFCIAGADKVFYPASAVIVNNSIVVSAAKVKKPLAVRYAFTNYPVTNLENTNGFPAVPFRTDDWQEIFIK
jgi:sialate O-acetylesterase